MYRILNAILSIIAFFLGLRFLLELFAANSSTPFVAWIYQVSDNLIYPFKGIFPNPVLEGGHIFDMVALISLLAYSLIVYLVALFIDDFRRPVNTVRTWF